MADKGLVTLLKSAKLSSQINIEELLIIQLIFMSLTQTDNLNIEKFGMCNRPGVTLFLF